MRYIDLKEDITAAPGGKKKRASDAEFIAAAKKMFPEPGKLAKLTAVDLDNISNQSGLQMPSKLRMNTKVDKFHWNLSGASGDDAEVNAKIASDLGLDVDASHDEAGEEYTDALQLAKAKQVAKLAATGKLYLFGRKPKGAFFRVPGLEEYTAQLERMLARHMAEAGDLSMEKQYELLIDKVKLVAGGKSQFIKSLLITGAPSSGKTYNVMEAVHELGLKEGDGYVVRKGRITVLSMYRTLIEQVNDLTIFDDCDSVVEDKNGINMLKGALDTDPIREISYDVRGNVNTAALSSAERDEYVDALSRALRFRETPEDISYFTNFLSRIGLLSKIIKGAKKPKPPSEDDDGDSSEEFEDEGDQDKILHYVRTHLPNKINYKGRIIFISNMSEDEWDSAILTRALYQNMNFRSDEMLDFIDKIKSHIKTPGLNDEEKQEVVDFIRELHTTGKLKRPVNFRLVQQGFDLRLTPNWKTILRSY